MKLPAALVTAVALMATGAVAQNVAAPGVKFGTKPVITLAIAKQLAAAILKASCKNPPPPGERPVVTNGVEGDCIGSVAIADDAGTVFYLETLDGTQAPSVHMAIQKGTNMSYLDGSFPLTTAPGGEPLYLGNDCVGGIGFSGQDPDHVMAAAMAEWKKITERQGGGHSQP